LPICIGSAQWIGERKRQEDSIAHAIGPDGRALLVLCDGMGGHAGGDVASKIAASVALEALLNPYETAQGVLENALTQANEQISNYTESNPETEGMGTTIVCAIIENNRLWWSSVGDSHLYLFRSGTVHKLNADHSMKPVLEKMADEGEITHEQARTDPKRNALRSAIMGNDLDLFEVSENAYPLQIGDTIILCTDGMDTLGEERDIEAFLENSSDMCGINALAQTLLTGVQDVGRPRQDNTTILTATISSESILPVTVIPEKISRDKPKPPIKQQMPLAIIALLCAVSLWLGYTSWTAHKTIAEISEGRVALTKQNEALEDSLWKAQQAVINQMPILTKSDLTTAEINALIDILSSAKPYKGLADFILNKPDTVLLGIAQILAKHYSEDAMRTQEIKQSLGDAISALGSTEMKLGKLLTAVSQNTLSDFIQENLGSAEALIAQAVLDLYKIKRIGPQAPIARPNLAKP